MSDMPIYLLERNGSLYSSDGSSTTYITDVGFAGTGIFCATYKNELWTVSDTAGVYRWDGGSATACNTGLTGVTTYGSIKVVYSSLYVLVEIGSTLYLYKWNDSGSTWEAETSIGLVAEAFNGGHLIEAEDGKVGILSCLETYIRFHTWDGSSTVLKKDLLFSQVSEASFEPTKYNSILWYAGYYWLMASTPSDGTNGKIIIYQYDKTFTTSVTVGSYTLDDGSYTAHANACYISEIIVDSSGNIFFSGAFMVKTSGKRGYTLRLDKADIDDPAGNLTTVFSDTSSGTDYYMCGLVEYEGDVYFTVHEHLYKVVADSASLMDSSSSYTMQATKYHPDAPDVLITDITRPTGSELVVVTFDLYDPDSSSLTVSGEYTTDGGENWADCTISDSDSGSIAGNDVSGLTSSPTGTSHNFTWDAGTDLASQNFPEVNIRVRATD